jgi:hypothetical protein
MEIGQAKGLAANLQFDQRINDLRYREQEDARAKATAEARAKMYADDMDYQNAVNDFDSGIIKDRAKQQTEAIGRYVRENPDYTYNADKLMQVNAMKRELKDNSDLHRGMASDTARKAYLQDLQESAKNPLSHDAEAYAQYEDQWKNYLQYGNQDGADAARGEGRKAFLYSKPRELRQLETDLPKVGNTIKDYDIVNTENGGWYTKPKAGQLESLRTATKQDYARELELAARKYNLNTEEKMNSYVDNLISTGFDKSHTLGDPLALRRMRLAEAQFGLDVAKEKAKAGASNGIVPYKQLMDPSIEKTQIPKKVFDQVWDPKNIQFPSTKGMIDLSGHNFNFDGTIYKPQGKNEKYRGMPFATGYVELSPQEAKELGIVTDVDAFGFGPSDSSAEGWRVEKGFNPDRVQIKKVYDADGKTQVKVKLLTEVPLNPADQTAMSLYQSATAPAKEYADQTSASSRQQAPQGAQVDSKGNVFDANGNYLGPASSF